MGSRAGALVALLALASCGGESGSASSDAGGAEFRAAPGRLVIVGGALSAENAEVYQAILDGREGSGPLCVLPTAGGDPQASMTSAVATLERYAGPQQVAGIPLSLEDPDRAHDPAVAAEIAGCSGFYFTGGVQSRVLDVFLPQGDTTAAYRALWARWQAGAVVAGSSAGAAMMSRVMIASGNSADALEHGLAGEEDGDGVALRGGMGFFPGALLDQHFLARGRMGRLLVAVLAADSVAVGLGIDENTALVVDGDSARVVGASGVIVVDGRGVERVAPLRGKGIRVALAGAGDVVALGTLQTRRGAGKEPLPVGAEALTLPDDPWARWALLHLLVELGRTPDAEASFVTGGARVTLREGEGFSAVAGGAEGGVQGTPLGFSAGPFVVDVVPAGS